jgi:hypothetical protein
MMPLRLLVVIIRERLVVVWFCREREWWFPHMEEEVEVVESVGDIGDPTADSEEEGEEGVDGDEYRYGEGSVVDDGDEVEVGWRVGLVGVGEEEEEEDIVWLLGFHLAVGEVVGWWKVSATWD